MKRSGKAAIDLGATFPDERGSHEPIPISLDEMATLVTAALFNPADEDSWNPKAILGLLASSHDRFKGRGWLYCRRMKRKQFRQGALSGAELTRLRGLKLPVLCVFLDHGHEYKDYEHDFTYPSLVIPDADMVPAHVFNVTE
jgi:hypothetical protein